MVYEYHERPSQLDYSIKKDIQRESENSTYVKTSCKEKLSQHEKVPEKEWIQSQRNFLNRENTATYAFLDPL